MQTTYLLWITLFGAILYMMIVDQNVAEYIKLLSDQLRMKLQLWYSKFVFHPFWYTNPIGRWYMMRKYRKMADEMMKNIKEKNQNKE